MRDREKQRALKKLQQLEKLNYRDECGVPNPTPYYAVLEMRKEYLDILHGRRKERKPA